MASSGRFLDATIKSEIDSKLKLLEFSGTESVSTLFHFKLTLLADNPITRAELESQLLGNEVTVTASFRNGKRNFSGFISDVSTQAVHDGRTTYHASMVPFLWFLSKSSDCRVFQNESTIDIVKKVINGAGEVIDKTGGKNVTTWPYSVQYRETDLNFISRLLEQDGIFYYFQHEGESHKLVLGNANSHFMPPQGKPLKLRKGFQNDGENLGELDTWQMELSTVSGKWNHGDYNFTDAKTKLERDNSVNQSVSKAKSLELYDFPGEYQTNEEGKKFAQIRAEEAAIESAQYSGVSYSHAVAAGRKLQIGENPHPGDANQQFIPITVSHFARASDSEHGGSLTAIPYQNSFTAIREDCPFRPPRRTPKPSVNGLQSAIVVGPSTEEIYTDEYGRVKVRFHWDRESHNHDACSCWIRVAQLMAGREWGFMAIPRIGQEVVINFLDGDPDRPLIVGSVYNSEQMPAYDPREMATRMYLKSNSTKGGSGFNEIMLDDRKDSERLFLHAQKDMDIRVRNDVRSRIYGNQHHVVGWEKDGQKAGSQYTRVLQDNHLHVERDQDEHLEGNYRLMVGGGQSDAGGMLAAIFEKQVAISVGVDGLQYENKGDVIQDIAGSSSTTVKKDVKTQIDGGMHFTIKGDHNEQANNVSLDLKQMANVKAGMKVALEGGNEVHIKSGMNLVIEAGMALSLKVGGNFINISPAGIFIQGTIVGINSGGAAGPGSGCMVMPPLPPDPLVEQPEKAMPTKPDHAHKEKTGYPSN